MSIYVQFIVLGLGLGAAYVSVGSGLLLMYRATGIVNFAQAAMGMWGAFVFYRLRLDGTLVLPIGHVQLSDMPLGLWLSVGIGVVYAVLLGIACYWLVFRPVRHAPELAQVVVSVALMLTMAALATIRFGSTQVTLESIIDQGSVTLLGTTVSKRELVMAGVMVVIAAVMWSYLRFTRFGVATRASAENERAVVLMGFSPHLLATIALGAGTGISAVGIMFAGTLSGLSVSNSLSLIVPATAVLLIARMQSVWTVLVSGLVLGSFQSTITLLTSKTWWPDWARSGIEYVVFFAIVITILLVSGRRLPSRGSIQTVRLPDVELPRLRLVPSAILVVVALVALLLTSGSDRFALTTSLIMMILCLSYVMLVGLLGQVSLAQVAFAGAAGFLLSKITVNTGIPFPLTILVCALGAMVLGVVVALPAIRIRGSQLAIVTLAAALVLERFIFGNVALTPLDGNLVKPGSIFGIDLAVSKGDNVSRLPFSIMVLVVLVLVAALFARVASGTTGRIFLAVRANERSAASSGVDVRLAKLMGFGLSAFIAGLAGTLIGYSQGQLSQASFSVFTGLTLLAIAYLGGITSIGGALVAGMIAPAGYVYTITHDWLNADYYALISGIALIVTAILNPVGIAGATKQQVEWVRRRMGRTPPPPGDAPVQTSTADTTALEGSVR
ncbi:MAG: ABC transporter permease [Aeromicrobium sp.]